MKNKRALICKTFLSVVLISSIILVVVLLKPLGKVIAQNKNEADELLESVSSSLEGEKQADLIVNSPTMVELVINRQIFYDDYFTSALHSDLLGLQSEYTITDKYNKPENTSITLKMLTKTYYTQDTPFIRYQKKRYDDKKECCFLQSFEHPR